MKRILISLVAFVAVGAMAQEESVQSGMPATLEAINGKQARVLLQGLEDGNLTFQPYKSTRDISVGIEKVSSLTFYPKYDEAAVQANVNDGDYPAVISTLSPLLEPYWDYMLVDNNLREAFCVLMDAYRKTGEYTKVRNAARILVECGDPDLEQRGQVNLALSALAEGDQKTAEEIRGKVDSEAAGLYLQASLERADNNPKLAIRTVTKIINQHANDVDWLAPSELISAHLYLDMGRTNSALNTARQVMNMYSGTSTAADAKKLWISLGGEKAEAAAAEERAFQKARAKAAQEKRAVEAKAAKEKEEAEEKAKMEAEAVAQAGEQAETDVNATTEMESE